MRINIPIRNNILQQQLAGEIEMTANDDEEKEVKGKMN